MALSPSLIEEHITAWTRRLAGTSWPYRRHWPRRLFRHEPVQNAVQVLRACQLLSRQEVRARGIDHLDIADSNVINTRDDAYEFVRLYFRPRNPTQYRIEGVRRPEECPNNDPQRQAAVLVMLAFDAKTVLTRPGVRFSDGNMQAQGGRTHVGDDDRFFRGIDFEMVYHEGSFDPQSQRGWDIRRARNAEVLAPSPLFLDEQCLPSVICRTPAERATLLFLLGAQAPAWSGRILVEPTPGIFFREMAFIESVEADSKGVTVGFNARRDNQPVRVSLSIEDENGRRILHPLPEELDLSIKWRWSVDLRPGRYVCEVLLEGFLAHRAPFLIDDLPF